MSKTKVKKAARGTAKKAARHVAKKKQREPRPVSSTEALHALDEIGRASEAAGTDKITDEEIEAEVRAHREGR